VKGPVAAAKTGSIPSLNPVGSVPTAFPFSLVAPPTTVPTATSQGTLLSSLKITYFQEKEYFSRILNP